MLLLNTSLVCKRKVMFLLGGSEGTSTVSRRFDDGRKLFCQFGGSSWEGKVIDAFGQDFVGQSFDFVMLGDGHDLFGIADVDGAVVDTWDVALDVDEVERTVNSDDGEVLDCDLVSAHASSHFLSREDTTGILGLGCDVRKCGRLDGGEGRAYLMITG